ncbi:hypothetical protein JCM19233_4890 [Vibrio astriarenae]|nr:hypothetical protein JCM19233_4890 [Vibrio sp. C7]
MRFNYIPPSKRPIYFELHGNGIYATVDGEIEYFRNRHELYSFAAHDERELIEVTPENHAQLLAAGAFAKVGDYE